MNRGEETKRRKERRGEERKQAEDRRKMGEVKRWERR